MGDNSLDTVHGGGESVQNTGDSCDDFGTTDGSGEHFGGGDFVCYGRGDVFFGSVWNSGVTIVSGRKTNTRHDGRSDGVQSEDWSC